MLGRTLATIVCAALALALAATALGNAPRTSLPEIEREVMCPTCGVPLEQAFSPQAERERRRPLTDPAAEAHAQIAPPDDSRIERDLSRYDL